ncbi:hypothetical protein [Glutamicibacter sp. V16R2B1]|uniref:hypothetical protein n=1 Tax=Glutamicibacter sp. V16R2B1 TaxID=2036207 RepID=UPI0010FDED90|nr:hypothetical protein [Glutamicibacter sp. V16R2B1]TLK48809.1 hypothetical protein FDN03_14545 [Glutamicibacter sp. V16R2B1]
MRSAVVDGFLAMVYDDFSVVNYALRLQAAADFADDGAHAYRRYMAGELNNVLCAFRGRMASPQFRR